MIKHNRKFWLQLLANEAGQTVHTTEGYANNVTGTETKYPDAAGNDLSAGMRTYYSNRILDYAQPYLRYEEQAKKEPIPPNAGRIISFHGYEKLGPATTALKEGITPEAGKLDMFTKTIELSQYGYYVEVSDLLKLTFVDPIVEQALKVLGRQAALTRDTLIRNALAGSVRNYVFAPKSDGSIPTALSGVDATCLITQQTVRRAANALERMDAQPRNGQAYIGIVHPDIAMDLENSPDFKEWTKYTTAEHMINGEIGMVGGVRFVKSTQALIKKEGTLPLYHTYIMGEDAYSVTNVGNGGIEVIVKQLGSGGTTDPLNQRATIGWKTNLGVGVMDETAIVDLVSVSSYGTAAKDN